MAASLGDLREALIALGLSTSTDSLRGEERRAALEQRLLDAKWKLGAVENGNKRAAKPKSASAETLLNVDAFRSMALSELRGELEAHQVSTQTPGLKGEARRHALIQRLQNATTTGHVRPLLAFQQAPKQPADAEALKSSRSSESSYSAASEFLFFDSLSTREEVPVSSVPTLRFPAPPASDRLVSAKTPSVSTPVREQLERELVELRKQLHDARAERSQTTSRRLVDAGIDLDLDKLSLTMAKLEQERQRLLRVAFAHELVTTTVLPGRQVELLQQDAVMLIEKQQQSLRRQIQCVKHAIMISRDNQDTGQEDANLQDAIHRSELCLQQCAPGASSRSSVSPALLASCSNDTSVLTRCQSVPSHLSFHEAWNDLDESQRIQLHQELRASKSFRIQRDRICVGTAPATARFDRPDGSGRQGVLAFTRYPPTTADKLGIKALFLEQSQRANTEIRQVYELALASEPGHALVLGNYARFLYEKCRDLPRAEQCFAKAIQADPQCASNVAAYASFLHHARSELARAEMLYTQALQLTSNDPRILGSYASLLRNQANGSVAQLLQAKELLVRALEVDKHSLANRLLLCALLGDLGDAAGALRQYEQLVQEIGLTDDSDHENQNLTPRTAASNAQWAHVYGNFANFLMRSRHVHRAKQMYENALRLRPDDAVLQRNFSLLLRDYKPSPRPT